MNNGGALSEGAASDFPAAGYLECRDWKLQFKRNLCGEYGVQSQNKPSLDGNMRGPRSCGLTYRGQQCRNIPRVGLNGVNWQCGVSSHVSQEICAFLLRKNNKASFNWNFDKITHISEKFCTKNQDDLSPPPPNMDDNETE